MLVKIYRTKKSAPPKY